MSGDRDIIDAIDELVDESLARGPVDDYSMNYYDKCQYCGETWHALATTHEMQVMRSFGMMDPEYRYASDTSDFICPGSEYKGPPISDREWKWAKKKWGRSRQQYARFTVPVPATPRLPPGLLQTWRFSGPWEGFDIALNDVSELEDTISGTPDDPHTATAVRGRVLTLEFDLTGPVVEHELENREEWLAQNSHLILRTTITPDGTFHEMPNIVIPFQSFRVDGDANNPFPDWIELDTTYDVTRQHPWFAGGWEVRDGPSEQFLFSGPPTYRSTDAIGATQQFVLSGEPTLEHTCCAQCSPGVYHHLLHDHGVCEASMLDNIFDDYYETPDDSICRCGRTDPHIDCPITHMRQGYESDYVIIDETHTFTSNNERLHDHVEQVRNQARIYAAATEAPAEYQWRQELLRRRQEDQAQQDRRMAAQAQAGAFSTPLDSALFAGDEEADEAGGS